MDSMDRKLMEMVNDLEPSGFRQLTIDLVQKMELDVSSSRMKGGDIIIEAVKSGPDGELPFIIKFKRGRGKVGPDHVQEIVGKKRDGAEMKPVFISTSDFTQDAQRYADLLNVNLAGGDKFAGLLREFGMDRELRDALSKKVLEAEGERFLPSIDELENQMRWGNDFFQSHNYKKALEYYEKALVMKPNYDVAWIMKGNSLNALERFDEASKAFEKAIESNPESEEAWYNLGATLYRLGRLDEELAAYDQALALNPDFIKAWNNKGATLHEMGKYEEAILCYDKVINLEPDNINVLNNRGVALKHLEEYEDALESFDRAISKDPEYTDAWINKALLLHEMERYEEAVQCFDHVLDKFRGPELYYQKGLALMRMENFLRAVEAFDNALLLKPRWKLAEEQKTLAEEGVRGMEERRMKEELLRRQEEEAERRVREEEARAREEATEVEAMKIVEDGLKPDITDEKLADDFEDVMSGTPGTPSADAMADLCNECNTELNVNARFCHNCGTRVVLPSEVDLVDAIYCPECETELDVEDDVCGECGHLLNPEYGEVEEIIEEEESVPLPEIQGPVGPASMVDKAALKRAAEMELEDERIMLESGTLLARMGEHDRAMRYFDKAIALDETPELWMEMGNLYFRMENYDEAVLCYNRVLKNEPESIVALLNKQAALIFVGEYEDALNVNSRALDINDERPVLWASRAHILLEQGNVEKAVEAFDRAVELAPDLVELWNAQGAALLRLGKYEEALVCFDRAIQTGPEFAEAWCNKGTARLSSGKPPDVSLRYFDRAMDIDPDYARAWNNKAAALYEMGRLEDALVCMDRCIEIEDDPLYFNNKGFLLLSQDNLDGALENLDYALELDDEYPEAWNNRGIALNRAGETVDALECFEKALAISPDFKDARRNRDAAVRMIEKKAGVPDGVGPVSGDDREGIHIAEELEMDELTAGELKCPGCGAPGSIEDRYCDECGTEFSEEKKEEAKIDELGEMVAPDAGKAEKDNKKRKGPTEKAAGHGSGKSTKERFTNELVKVPGVGFSKAGMLYDEGYDSFEKLKEASIDDLSSISGISKKLARNIKKVYN